MLHVKYSNQRRRHSNDIIIDTYRLLDVREARNKLDGDRNGRLSTTTSVDVVHIEYSDSLSSVHYVQVSSRFIMEVFV